MGDISDLKPNKGVRKSQKVSLCSMMWKKESVLKKKNNKKQIFLFFYPYLV